MNSLGRIFRQATLERAPLVSEAITLLKAQQKERERRQRDEDAPPRDREEIDYVFVGTGSSVRNRPKKAPSAATI